MYNQLYNSILYQQATAISPSTKKATGKTTKATKKAVKTDDLKGKSKTPILDIVEGGNLTPIETTSKTKTSKPKVAKKSVLESASNETTQISTNQSKKTEFKEQSKTNTESEIKTEPSTVKVIYF